MGKTASIRDIAKPRVIVAECLTRKGKRKSGDDQLLPVAPEFAEMLLSIPQEQRTGRVFKIWQRVENAEVNLIHVSATVTKFGRLAAVKVNTDSRNGRAKYASAHDFRRSFGERWSLRVMPAVLQQMMRHKDVNTTMKYDVGQNGQKAAADIYAAFAASGLRKSDTFSDTAEIDATKESSQQP